MGAIKLHTSTLNYPFKKVLNGWGLRKEKPVPGITNSVCVHLIIIMKRTFALVLFIGSVLFIFSCGNKSQEKNNNYRNQNGKTKVTGETNYQKYCVACHGSDGNLSVAGAKNLPGSILTQPEREQIIRNGKGSMPAFSVDKMSDEEVKTVAEYTLTLK